MSSGHYRGNCAFAEGYRKINYKTKKAIARVSAENHAAGTMVGYYDEALTVLAASDDLLEDLGYCYEGFLQFTGGSLRRLLRPESALLATPQSFCSLHEGQTDFFTGDGRLVPVRLRKMDSVDADGVTVWVVSVAVEGEPLGCAAMGVGAWSMTCTPEGNITQVQWSRAFRQILGYRDVFDFPNRLESWASVLHPAECDAVLGHLMAAIWDRKGQPQLRLRCRLKKGDGSWAWFQLAADIARCPDGRAGDIRGVLIDIDREAKAAQQTEASGCLSPSALPDGACSEDVEHLLQKMSALIDRFAVCDLENDQYGQVSMVLKKVVNFFENHLEN